ncbi:hypothetical protein [Methyloversatilis sp.]|uniref:hypothetical protein n=1 Tax=Methyloversatilis sp. TaxID=2569862 RepID=UPI00273777DB|nr:hypothetical protein [Methyloversatilis sp.]MDP3579144.1 hypothetical protein [Methyloversatilis sp.]
MKRTQLHRAMVFAVALHWSGTRDRIAEVILILAAEVRRLRRDNERVRADRAIYRRMLIEEKKRKC